MWVISVSGDYLLRVECFFCLCWFWHFAFAQAVKSSVYRYKNEYHAKFGWCARLNDSFAFTEMILQQTYRGAKAKSIVSRLRNQYPFGSNC